MNIFATSTCPKSAAQDHCDKHLVKMILETAQLLSTAHHLEGEASDIPGIYKVTHENHPSAAWVRSTRANYLWAYDLFVALCDEYTRRYGRVHKTDTKLRAGLMTVPRHIVSRDLTAPPACMPDAFKYDAEGEWPVESYRRYLAHGKSWLTADSFKKRAGGAPAWFRTLTEGVPA
jgi:hypothetical protein